jgi:hypothetical protein
MDHVAFPIVVGGVVAIVATTFSLLPERLDVTYVFAAYGVGTIFGEVVAARKPATDPRAMMRRWGGLLMGFVGLLWLGGLLIGVL